MRRPEDLAFLYQHADFSAFLDHFRFAVLALRDVQDVHDVALDLFRELAAQNVVYAEVIFSAAIFVRAGMRLDELLAAVASAEETALGERTANADGLVVPRYNIVVDVVRNFGAGAAERLVADLVRLGHPRVVGIHLGGDEVAFPAADFAAAFARAREAGLGCAAHAGEAAGASVWDAIDRLGVQRSVIRSGGSGAHRQLVRRRITLRLPTSTQHGGRRRSPCTRSRRWFAGVAVTLRRRSSFFDGDLSASCGSCLGPGLLLDVVHGFAVAGLEELYPQPNGRAAAGSRDAVDQRTNSEMILPAKKCPYPAPVVVTALGFGMHAGLRQARQRFLCSGVSVAGCCPFRSATAMSLESTGAGAA
jgi:hypothetical protein